MEPARFEPAEFLNIDLEIKSRRSLEPLVEAWPWVYQPAKIEGHKPRWLLLNVYSHPQRPAEGTARQLLRHIEKLRGEALRSWKDAYDRVFDIGIQAPGLPGRPFEVGLTVETLRRIAAVGARINFTVYAAELEGSRYTPTEKTPSIYIPPKRNASKRR